ncbi:hypothetical protein [uncultured Tenacibaculum sp.]|uniref:hypothetical protein n=1 Tax=uncultured Tenacibaculum sp. TaxID=174713 RepID=UPI00260A80C3|nr:hypothetical protein [uncultured Tenacibaculum sp.]
MNENKPKLSDQIAGVVVFTIIIGFFTFLIRKDYLIINYKKQTIGTIIKYDDSSNKHSIKYKYKVNGRLYFKTLGVRDFSKADRKKCKGYKIFVNYYSKNPNYTHVHLGKYEDRRSTTYFFNSFNYYDD